MSFKTFYYLMSSNTYGSNWATDNHLFIKLRRGADWDYTFAQQNAGGKKR